MFLASGWQPRTLGKSIVIGKVFIEKPNGRFEYVRVLPGGILYYVSIDAYNRGGVTRGEIVIPV